MARDSRRFQSSRHRAGESGIAVIQSDMIQPDEQIVQILRSQRDVERLVERAAEGSSLEIRELNAALGGAHGSGNAEVPDTCCTLPEGEILRPEIPCYGVAVIGSEPGVAVRDHRALGFIQRYTRLQPRFVFTK